MQLRFVTSESAFDYFRATRAYVEEHGKPVAFYSDKHGIFRVNSKEAAGGEGVTQFGRALLALNIDIICANSPQAKGRIERAFGTLQDRMVKELRLAGVSSMAAANAWLPGFITAYNTRFGRDPANAKDLHRPLAQADDLDEILAWREERTVTRNLTLHYDRMMLLLDPTPAFAGAGSAGPWVGAQEGGGRELPGRAVRGSVQRSNARFQGVRQDPNSAARRDRRQQAAVGRVGAGQGAAGRLSGAAAAGTRCAAAAAQQPRGAGSAVEGAGPTPRCCRGCGLRQRTANRIEG
jgi:hypothetical protein